MVNVNFIGRLGGNAEVKVSQKGNQFVVMNVATDEFKKGEKSTSWLRVTCLDDRTLKMVPYLTKGKLISIIGTETVSAYQSRTGQLGVDRTVIADRIEFVGGGKSQDEQAAEVKVEPTMQPTATVQESTTQPMPSVVMQTSNVASQVGDEDDDLPF